MKSRLGLFLSAILYLFLSSPSTGWAKGSLLLSPSRPVVGQKAEIKFEVKGNYKSLALYAIYAPNSKIERPVLLATLSNSQGQIEWSPARPGLVKLLLITSEGGDFPRGKLPKKAETVASKVVSVKYSSLPWLGIAIFIFAAGLLFGGMAFGFKLSFQSG